MAVRHAVKRQHQDPDDFIRTGQYNSLGPVGYELRQPDGPAVPPPIEEIILTTVVDFAPYMKGYVTWDKPGDWMRTTWPCGVASYLLWYMTTLSNDEIGDYIRCTGTTAARYRQDIERIIAARPRREAARETRKRVLDCLAQSVPEIERRAGYALLWANGVIVPSATNTP